MAQIVIYALCDPDTKARRYIGKANDLEARLRCHRWETNSSKLHTRKVNWLRSLKRDPFVEVLEACTKETWAERERCWISESRTRGDDLTNYADGGQTSPVEGKGHSEESKEKMRQSALRWGAKPPSRRGQPVSERARENLRLAALRIGSKPPTMGGWNKGIKRTHCPAGHPYSPENTRIQFKTQEGRSYQSCKICCRASQLRHRQRRAA